MTDQQTLTDLLTRAGAKHEVQPNSVRTSIILPVNGHPKVWVEFKFDEAEALLTVQSYKVHVTEAVKE